MTDLERAVRTVLVDCLGVKHGEDVLVVTDPARRSIAEALVKTARDLGAEAILAEMAERANHGTEPPRAVAAAMGDCDVLIAPTSKSLSHTEARHEACARGARVATMPGVTEDMLARTMSVDFPQVARRSRVVADLLTEGSSVRITTEVGTEVTIGIAGREGLADDGDLRARGAFGNLPAGEGFVAPVEGTTTGRVVFDGSVWPLGLLREPLTVELRDGYASEIRGNNASEWRAVLESHGREAFAVAELGIGTNDAAKLTGNVLEDEKILGTIHIALGDNHTFGGNIRVSSHQDGVVLKPSVFIDENPVLEDGRLVI
ncbi:MAG: aminopeptidase [Actinomycetota bacterium]|nr:aminopeptidase [Actinomycetota bacterium]